MTFALGTATGKIELEYDGTGVKQAEDDIDGLGKKSGNTNASLRDLSNTSGMAGLAIAAGLGVGVNMASNFEASMSAVQAVSGATGKDFDALRDKALQLGADTSFSAGEAALAIEELAKAGLAVPDILNGAADAAVALAAAGEIALPEAAMIASNAMNQFGIAAADMPKVADLFAGAANTSATGVSEIGQALQQVGAVANLVGVSLEDVTAAIALMGNAGIQGSDAGTSLKSMFTRLNPSTKEAKDLMKELGIITEDGSNRFYDAQGNMKGLAQVAQTLKGSLKGMTAEQKQATLTTLFGSDAIRAAAILAKSGSKGFNDIAKSMGEVSAADVAAKRLDNFKGSLEAMKGSMETAGIAVGTVLLPYLRDLADMLAQAANWFSSLSSTQQAWIVGVLAGVGALLLIVTSIMKLIIFINVFKTALIGLRAALVGTWLAALGPIALVIAIIALIVAAIVILWKKNEGFRNAVIAVWNAIKGAAKAVADWFMNTLVPGLVDAWNSIVNGVKAMGNGIKSAWDAVVGFVTTVFQVIVSIITTYINIWKTIITGAMNAILAVWSAIWNMFGPIITAVFGLIAAIIRLAWTVIKGLVLLGLMGIRAVFTAVWNAIAGVVRGAINLIMGVIRMGVAVWRAIITTAWNAIRAVTSAVWNAISGVIRGVWGVIGGTVRSAVNSVRSAITGAWNAVRSVTSRVWNQVVSVIGDAIGNIMSKVGEIQGKIAGFFAGAASWLYNAGRQIIQGLIDGISSMIGAVTAKINSVTDKIGKFLPGSPVREGPLKVLNQGYAGKQIIKMLLDGMTAQQSAVQSTAGGVAGMINDPIAPAAGRGGVVRPQGGSTGGTGRSRIIDGELRLVGGKAYVTAIAEDVLDEGDGFDDTIGRMN